MGFVNSGSFKMFDGTHKIVMTSGKSGLLIRYDSQAVFAQYKKSCIKGL